MRVFLPNVLCSEMTSRAEQLVALQDINVSVNEKGLSIFLVPDGIYVRLVLQPDTELFHSCSLNKDFTQPAYGKRSMALLAPKLPRHCLAECRFGEATVLPGALVEIK